MRQLMTLPKVKAIVMRLRAKSPPLMRQHLQSQSLSNPPRIQLPLILQVRRLLIRQLILRVRHLLIRLPVILRVRRLLIRQLNHQLIHQPRRQRNYVRVINHAPSSALK